jgi:hypothetical protein
VTEYFYVCKYESRIILIGSKFSVSLRNVTFIGEGAFAGKYPNPFCLVVLVWWVGVNAVVVFVMVSSMLYVCMYLCIYVMPYR